MSKHLAFLTIIAAVALVVSGCGGGPSTVPVSGKVTYQGKPLEFGTVMFQAESGPIAKAEIQPDGTFTLTTDGDPGAVVGMHQVRVACFSNQAPDSPPPPPDREPTLGRPLIPIKYNNFDQSGLVVEVTKGMEPVELNLQ